MKTEWRNILTYTQLIVRNWIPLAIVVLDIVIFAAQLFFPSLPFRLPQWAFLLVLAICLYWAGYQVYIDLASKLPSFPTEPPPYEVLSYSFDIYCDDIPHITVSLYVINYQPRKLVLESLEVTNFHLSSGVPYLDPIPHTEDTRIGARCSTLITCKRQLTDAEVKAITRTQKEKLASADFRVLVRALAGRQHLPQEIPLSLKGWLYNIPSPS